MKKEKTHCLKISFVVHPNIKCSESVTGEKTNNFHKHVVKVLDYPKDVIMRRNWYITYWRAKVQVRFPRHYVAQHVYGYYYPEDDEATIKNRQISSAKAQITKIKRLVDERKKELSKGLFQDFETDPYILKCTSKLEEKELKLSNLLNS